MDPKHLEALITVEREYWWHVAKRELIVEVLRRHFPAPARLVEGGIGGGANLLAFRELGYAVSGFDLMSEAVAHCQSIGIEDVRVLDLHEPWTIEAGPARVVVLLDVIEHVEHPAKVLANAAATLDAEGGIVITVPAIPALMGPWDRMLGHYRRYSRAMLREHAREAGLKVAWLSHWNAFSLPPALVVRTLEKLGKRGGGAEFPAVSPALNSTLIAAARAERSLIMRTGLMTGLSLVGVLKK